MTAQAPSPAEPQSVQITPERPGPPATGNGGGAPRRRGSMRRRVGLVLLLALLGALVYGGYWWVYLRGTIGTDDAYVDASISALSMRIPGRIASVAVQAGDRVKQGQVLARLDTDTLKIAVAQARAVLAEAQAHLAELKAGPRPEQLAVSAAQVRLRQVQLAQAQRDLQRDTALLQRHAISQVDLEHQRFAVEQAKAELELSRRNDALLRAGSRAEAIAVAQAQMAQARARLNDARATLDEAVLRCPVEGVVADRTAEPGQVVQPGQALFQVVDTRKVWVVANLQETDLEGLKQGQPVDVSVDAYPDVALKGRVGPQYGATLSRFSLLSSNSASGSFIKVTQRVPVRIDLVSKELPPLYPGLNAVIRIHLHPSGGR